MPTFYLNIRNHDLDARDLNGLDLPDLEAARAEAIKGIRGHLGHEAMAGKLDLRGEVTITDPAGTVLDTIRFEDAVTIIGP